jgi:predicted nucleic acid-binding protein
LYKVQRVYRGKTRETRYVQVLICVPRALAERVGISLDPGKSDYVAIALDEEGGRLIVKPFQLEDAVGLAARAPRRGRVA